MSFQQNIDLKMTNYIVLLILVYNHKFLVQHFKTCTCINFSHTIKLFYYHGTINLENLCHSDGTCAI